MTAAISGNARVSLPTDDQILITRDFDAPRRLVYKAWTTPELVKRWWTAGRGEMTVAEIDLRVGGRWRYAMRSNQGFEVAFHGEYQELVPDVRIVSTEVYEGAPNAQALDTVTFAELDGRTTLTIRVQHSSRANRDAQLNSGMEEGLQEALDLLEQTAISLRSGPPNPEESAAANPALRELGVLVGDWEIEISGAAFLPSPEDKAHGHVRFEWIEGGAVLAMRQGAEADGPPAATFVIGRDETDRRYKALYSDTRGVSRVYDMSFSEGVWKLWRDTDDFSQRFEGTVDPDQQVIAGVWEKAVGDGEWEHDFDLKYTRSS